MFDFFEAPGAFFGPFDLSDCGYLYNFYLRSLTKSSIEHDEKDAHDHYLKYIKYVIHKTTPLEHDNEE